MQPDRAYRGDDPRPALCGFCGHGAELHAGTGSPGRPDGWCIACDERRRDEQAAKRFPMCWWLTP